MWTWSRAGAHREGRRCWLPQDVHAAGTVAAAVLLLERVTAHPMTVPQHSASRFPGRVAPYTLVGSARERTALPWGGCSENVQLCHRSIGLTLTSLSARSRT